MVKMKVKKELTLPELLEWAWENDVEFEHFCGSRKTTVYFGSDRTITMNGCVPPDEIFTVEVEEEIDENTVIPKLVYHYAHNGMSLITTRSEKSISEVLKINTKAEGFMNIAFYMLNDDMTMTLLWRNGGMVE